MVKAACRASLSRRLGVTCEHGGVEMSTRHSVEVMGVQLEDRPRLGLEMKIWEL